MFLRVNEIEAILNPRIRIIDFFFLKKKKRKRKKMSKWDLFYRTQDILICSLFASNCLVSKFVPVIQSFYTTEITIILIQCFHAIEIMVIK